MIRLSLLIPTLDRSGAEKQLTLLATGLPREEFDVRVIALTRGGPYAEILGDHGIRVTILGKRHKLDPKTWRDLRWLLRQSPPDVLHTWLFAANSYGRLAVDRPSTTRVVVSERCVDTWKAEWQLWLDRRLISRTDLLIGNSQSVVDFYVEQGFPVERTAVIYNGMDVADVGIREGEVSPAGVSSASVDRAQLVKEFGLPANARLVGFVGRLARQKRVEDLIWGMQLVRQVDPRAYLLVVGDGPERARLQQFAQDVECREHVRFLGHREDAAQLMRLLDVFWLGSDFEGLSNSLMEAMAAGVPVVATNIPPNRELIRHGQEGYLVDVGECIGFAQFTNRLINDPQLSSRMGAAGRSRIEEQFGVQKMVDAHITVYRQLCESSG